MDSLFNAGATNANTGVGTLANIINLLSGGALSNFSVLAMGVYPYITAQIIIQLLAGVIPSLERMLRELQPDIRRYARRQCHRTSAIEDVVQEALIVLYRRLGNVRDPLAIAGWIFRVVTRLCMLPVLGLIRGAEELTERHEAEYFAQVPRDELRIDLVRALESLPDMYREVILLRDMEQLTIGEVADHLRITREACKSRIHRGRALLREYLQGDEPRAGKK